VRGEEREEDPLRLRAKFIQQPLLPIDKSRRRDELVCTAMAEGAGWEAPAARGTDIWKLSKTSRPQAGEKGRPRTLKRPVRQGMQIVEVFADGSEEHLPQGMELEADAPGPSTPPQPVKEAAMGDDKPSRMVKLLPGNPATTMPAPKLMLWVDGCLAPALSPPALISPCGDDLQHSVAIADTLDASMAAAGGGESPAAAPGASAAVVAAAAAAVRGAVHSARERLDSPLTCESPNGAGRSSSVELTPSPLVTGKPNLSAKRTRPASACAATPGWGVGYSRPPSLLSHAGSFTGSVGDGVSESRGSVQGLSDVLGDWGGLESPTKRQTISRSEQAGSPPALSSASMPQPPLQCRSPAITSCMLTPARPAPARPGPPVRPPSEAAAGVCSSVARSLATAAAAVAAGSRPSPTSGPSAPPPSPVLGPRPTPREIFPGLAKRKGREELPALLAGALESGLDALRIEPRPHKLVRLSAGR
jgi:hypothetical protein